MPRSESNSECSLGKPKISRVWSEVRRIVAGDVVPRRRLQDPPTAMMAAVAAAAAKAAAGDKEEAAAREQLLDRLVGTVAEIGEPMKGELDDVRSPEKIRQRSSPRQSGDFDNYVPEKVMESTVKRDLDAEARISSAAEDKHLVHEDEDEDDRLSSGSERADAIDHLLTKAIMGPMVPGGAVPTSLVAAAASDSSVASSVSATASTATSTAAPHLPPEPERRALFSEQASLECDDDLPFVPTTLPMERSQAVPIVPVRERAARALESPPPRALERPRASTPLSPAILDAFVRSAPAAPQPPPRERLTILLPPPALHPGGGGGSGALSPSGRRAQAAAGAVAGAEGAAAAKAGAATSPPTSTGSETPPPRSWQEFAERGMTPWQRRPSLPPGHQRHQPVSPPPPPLPPRRSTGATPPATAAASTALASPPQPPPSSASVAPAAAAVASPVVAAAAAGGGGGGGGGGVGGGAWVNLEEVPERRRPPRRIQTLPSSATRAASVAAATVPNATDSASDAAKVVYNYVNPEDCTCECHEATAGTPRRGSATRSPPPPSAPVPPPASRRRSQSPKEAATAGAAASGVDGVAGGAGNGTCDAPGGSPEEDRSHSWRLEVSAGDRRSYLSDSSVELCGSLAEGDASETMAARGPFGADLDVRSNRSSGLSQDETGSPEALSPPATSSSH